MVSELSKYLNEQLGVFLNVKTEMKLAKNTKKMIFNPHEAGVFEGGSI